MVLNFQIAALEQAACRYGTSAPRSAASRLNLDTADGRNLFRRLAATADVIVGDVPAGSFAAPGIDYQALRKADEV